MSRAAAAIEAFFSRRYEREALYLPSGRLALYLAFREWLRPGDRLLMSPVNDDVVFFTVLAAGLIPVIGPLDPATGNLDPEAVDESTWGGLNAVMTTNLYGIPDRMDLLEDRCRRYDLLLIEDACQALDSRFRGRRIGEWSPVAAFSLTKHIEGVGGVLVFSEAGRRHSLARRLEADLRKRSPLQSAAELARRALKALLVSTGTREFLGRLRRQWMPLEAERSGHRMPYRSEQVVRARTLGAGLDRFHRWVRVDNAAYRTEPLGPEAKHTLRQLESFEENRRRRLDGTRRLLELGLTPSDLFLPAETALFRVPLFVQERERVLSAFIGRGLSLDYIYDPPLDLYAATDLAERLPSPPAARRWSRDVLPVDPLHAGRFLKLLAHTPKPFLSSLEQVQ